VIGLPDVQAVPAFLRACLAGDEAGAAAIVHTLDPLPLLFAVAAWANVRGVAVAGSVESYDTELSAVLAAMNDPGNRL
jgi:hypothetical protein